ncbi:MAG: hypothetical protein PHQ80_02245 [Candidatus ainarchaeum sp.]|nr:hypothetical protein [Candidatus ainarchaeum sp.]
MDRDILVVLALLFVFAGCTMPEYRQCCLYANAEAGQCVLKNATAYDTNSCDMENLTCNVTQGDREMTFPICPRVEEVECNVSCAGMFCAKYEYDPRPPASPDFMIEAIQTEEMSREAGIGLGEDTAKGLYGTECRIENITPTFLNLMRNVQGGVRLNIFRFGVGGSFEEFDEAYMYYPLTDYACENNQFGHVDRYVNYMIPNLMGGGELCSVGGVLTPTGEIPQYFCNVDDSIRTFTYQDCATRCALKAYGDAPVVQPNNAYPTERNGMESGNPFAYGVSPSMHGSDPFRDLQYKSSIDVPPAFDDEYPAGYTYYGSEFANNRYLSNENGGWESIMLERGPLSVDVTTGFMDYYYGEETDQITVEGGNLVEEMTTAERDPHMLYSYLLSRHSVYSKQFKEGHYTPEGEWSPGAEFECTLEGGECVSGFCNTFDYTRGACEKLDFETGETEEVPCDCWEEYGDIVCAGQKYYGTDAWDNGEDITAAKPLGTLVEWDESFLGFSIGWYRSFPSTGKMFSYDPGGVFLDEPEGEEVQDLVILLGGREDPDYQLFEYSDELDDMNETLTIPQVLSRAKWSGCGAYSDCGKFYTTFVDACMPDLPDPAYSESNFMVCYSRKTNGHYGQGIDRATGEVYDLPSPSICEALYDADQDGHSKNDYGGVDKNSDTDHDVYCYARESDGTCVGYARAALVLTAREITYTNADGEEVIGKAFGNCILEEDKLKVVTPGYCEHCSFLTMAKENVVELPEDDEDPGYQRAGSGKLNTNKYCPSLEISTIYNNEPSAIVLAPGTAKADWESGGTHSSGGDEGNPYRYSECTMPDGTEAGKKAAWPDYLPNAYYLKKKIDGYLQRNVMPVIFADDDGLYRGLYPGTDDPALFVETDGDSASSPLLKKLYDENPLGFAENADEGGDEYTTQGTFLADSVMNLGAGIIVVRNFNSDDMEAAGGSPIIITETGEARSLRKIDYTLYARERAVRLMCPNCMVAVGIGYGEEGSGIPSRVVQLAELFDYRDSGGRLLSEYDDYGANASCFEGGAGCSQDTLQRVDILAVKWELGRHNSYCDEIENESDRFEAILADEVDFGAKTLKRFGKPVVVTDFSITRNQVGSCWDDESAKRFMIYLAEHTQELVKSGHIGLIYGNWTYGHSGEAGTRYIRTKEGNVGEYRGPFFEGTFQAARIFAGKNEQTIVNQIGVSEECACVACTSSDDASLCNGKFGGVGEYCSGYLPGISMKWPESCVSPDVCVSNEDLPMYRIECNVYHNDGSSERVVYDGADIAPNPRLYAAEIASIKKSGNVPCIPMGVQNGSFATMEVGGSQPYPILFRKDGNLSISCGGVAEEGFFSACGLESPFVNRRMDCVMAKKDVSITLPPLGVPLVTGGAAIPLAPGVEVPDMPAGPFGG